MSDRRQSRVQMRGRRVLLGSLLAAVLVMGACGDSDPEPRSFGAGQDNCTSEKGVDTLTLAFKGIQGTYKPGQTMFLTAVVERDDSPDVEALKANLHPGAVEGAEVSLRLDSKNRTLYGAETTGEAGTASVKIRIPRNMKRVTFDATGYAKKLVASGPCVDVSEEGTFQQAGFAKVK